MIVAIGFLVGVIFTLAFLRRPRPRGVFVRPTGPATPTTAWFRRSPQEYLDRSNARALRKYERDPRD